MIDIRRTRKHILCLQIIGNKRFVACIVNMNMETVNTSKGTFVQLYRPDS